MRRTTTTRCRSNQGSQEWCKRNKGQILVKSICNSNLRVLPHSSSPSTKCIRNRALVWSLIRIVRVNIPKAAISKFCPLIIRNLALRWSTSVSNLLPRIWGSPTLTSKNIPRSHFVSNQESTWRNLFQLCISTSNYRLKSKKCSLRECLFHLGLSIHHRAITVGIVKLPEIYLMK